MSVLQRYARVFGLTAEVVILSTIDGLAERLSLICLMCFEEH